MEAEAAAGAGEAQTELTFCQVVTTMLSTKLAMDLKIE